MMGQAGFENAEIVSDTGFNSSPITKGVLIRANRPRTEAKTGEERMGKSSPMEDYKKFFDKAYADGALDRKTKILVALGASLGAGCDP